MSHHTTLENERLSSVIDGQCSVAECQREAIAKTLCDPHYRKKRRYGNPLGGREYQKTPEARFAARTEWKGECLEWTGALRRGYGLMHVDGKHTSAHRWAYEKAYGLIPEGYLIDHRCRNKRCVRPKHLRLATRAQNGENVGKNLRNTSGYRNVSWVSARRRWKVEVWSVGKAYYGGNHPIYELHVAAYRARNLRLTHHTYNDYDRT